MSGTVTVSANASDNVGVTRVELFVDGVADRLRHDVAVPDRVEHDHGVERRPRAPDAGLRRRRERRLERDRQRHREQRRRRRRQLIVNGGFEGSAASWTLAGDAYWSAGGNQHSGTGYTVLGFYNNASGTEYQTVTIPAGHPANLTFWLNDHDERVA